MGINEYVKQEGRQEGIAVGQEKKSRLVVENLLKSTDFSTKKIASLVGVTVAFVNKVRNSMKVTKAHA